MLSGLERVIYRGTGVFEGEEDEDGGEVGRKELEAFLRENLETECGESDGFEFRLSKLSMVQLR